MATRTSLRLLFIAILALGLSDRAATQRDEDLQSLGPTVEAFLVEWMRGSPSVAAERYMSTVTRAAPQLLPSVPGTQEGPLKAAPAQEQMSNQLQVIRGSVRSGVAPASTILAPTRTVSAIPEIESIIGDLGLDLQALERPPALVYRVRNWKDIAWCGSVGPRHRAILEPETSGSVPLVGVIARLRSSNGTRTSPVLLLWRLEPAGSSARSWKLVTLFPILTN
jgi:hypothetical protein